MNILLINHYAGSSTMGMEFRPYYLAKYWQQQGHQVHIVAASFAHVRKKNPKISGSICYEMINNIHYTWLKTPSYQGNGLGRVLNIFSFVMRLALHKEKILRNFCPDVVIASSTYPLDVYPAHLIARKYQSRFVFEVHDLWPLSPIELGGMSPLHPFIWLMQRAENHFCKYADYVVSILPHTKAHLVSHGMEENKFLHIPNGIVPQDWDKKVFFSGEESSLIIHLKKKYKFIVGYTGSHGVANALDYLIDTAPILEKQSIALVLIGDGPEKPRLHAKAESWPNVVFMPPIEKAKVPAALTLFDALYIGWNKAPIYRFGISPNKIFDYMMAAKPIIHSIGTPDDIVTKANCGIACEAENTQVITDAILHLALMSPAKRAVLGENGKNHVLKYHDYEKLSYQFIQVFYETT